MTPPDQNDEQPSALSRLERALAGFGDPRAEEPLAESAAENQDEQQPADAVDETEAAAPVSPFETDAELEKWVSPATVASSPVLDIASAVEAVERLTASERGDTFESAAPADSLLDRPVSDADEFVLGATAAGRDLDEQDLRARVKEFAEDEVDDEDLRVGVDEGSDLADAPDEKFGTEEPGEARVDELPPPRVSDAAASWARDQGDTELPYFLVEDNLPVAAEPVVTLEELRQSVAMEPKHKASVARTLAEIPILLLVAALIAFLVKTFLAQAYYIPSSSMEPQLLVNDRVVVSKLAYEMHDPRRGDIVVFDDPNNSGDEDEPSLLHKIGEGIGVVQPSTDEFIKRVIALPGETVEGRDGAVYVNGRRLEEPYLPAGPRGVTTSFDKTTVRAGRVWVMGDNRTGSADSRVFGQIRIDSIVGRALVTVWPVNQAKFL